MPHAPSPITLVPSAPLHAGNAAADRADSLIAACLAAAAQGDSHAFFDLGVAFSTGSYGADCDLVEAHKWFNLAAVAGHDDAARARADVAEEMSARDIAEAQRRAREWMRAATRHAA